MNGLSNKEMKQTKPALARMTRSSLLISVLADARAIPGSEANGILSHDSL